MSFQMIERNGLSILPLPFYVQNGVHLYLRCVLLERLGTKKLKAHPNLPLNINILLQKYRSRV
jgi:hypothetical protein